MHGIDKLIEGYKTKLDLLIDKKNRLDLAIVTAYDEEKKFGLQQQVDGLEGEIKTLQDRIRELEQQKPATPATTPRPNTPQVPQNKDQLLALISDGQLKEALGYLSTLLPARERNDLVLLQSRFNGLERNLNSGIMLQADAGVERARITAATLAMCDRVEESAFAALPIPKTSTTIVDPPKAETSNGKKIFFSYSQYDRPYLDQLLRHMSGLRRQEKIAPWTDKDILPGEEWDDAIKNKLATADIILLLISSDFLATDYIWKVEIATAMERHERKEARVIPVFIRSCDWSGMPFSKLNGLPSKAKPVSSYADRDEAWVEVVKGIERVL
ncbi:MAG TPA: TIR domain-containing protein [Haliscomenobacter sp.]|uniref:TIR domain-containing protein n=1 Tax=Haliscomenobacter sp. TaxID=2717303 RepID=UPI002B9D7EAE|nr:TIR domain-containing protein [Haliscomenobacter sp.]HOY16953.1 TIR domain-containing protein [Haliscomenobacter sp.]